MAYCATNTIGRLACQARCTGCQCAQLWGEHRDYAYADTDKTYSGLTVEGSSSVSETGDIPRVAASLSLPVDLLVGSRRAEPMESHQAINYLTSVERFIDSSAPKLDDLGLRDDFSHPSSPQHQVVQRLLTLPYGCHNYRSSEDSLLGAVMSRGRADCLDSLFSLARPGDQLNPIVSIPQRLGSPEPPPGAALDPDGCMNDLEDPENIQGAITGFLLLDQNVESNSLPFLLHGYATWVAHFLFEPQRVVYSARYNVFRSYTMGTESRQIMNLLANNAYEITRSASYDPGNSPSFSQTESIIRRRLTEASTQIQPSRGSDMQSALEAMRFTYEFISSLCKVGSLSGVLNIMQLAAPVFRRACPDSLENLVNLPTLLTTMITPVQYYGSLDVLLSVLTGRPMFFRYSVEFASGVPESLFLLEDGPGIRWVYGVPDRLTLTFAKMNALLEDFGPQLGRELVKELEEEIKRMKPIVGSSTEPLLSVSRMVVQECWFLAALIYLYMGLCGADSTDTRAKEKSGLIPGLSYDHSRNSYK
ncbi:unnamed protein product [Rhizoctonia solani]|uniref:Uncharacterized protein n=1 Tax=Rhizoctonia solani TaxID=456999 RepID=A0A8H3GRG0_9AGAM|nr:unnamed protein product [Rhizoctonia solani]